jgi:transcriptional regulator with XRE-family HTH domain
MNFTPKIDRITSIHYKSMDYRMAEHSTKVKTDKKAAGNRLRRLRNMTNLPQREFCDGLGFSLEALRVWEYGKFGGLTKKGAKAVIEQAQRFGVTATMEWLLYNHGQGPSLITDFNEFETDQLHATTAPLTDDNERELIANELALFKSHHSNVADLVIIDDSMLPIFSPGDVIAGIKCFDKDINQLIGQTVIARTTTGELLLRQLHATQQQNHYTLLPTNMNTSAKPSILTDIELVFAAPTLWHRRSLI